ncbi:hypothetical protein Nepgr_003864 [Nepenthes gracilis]|uniref:Uncharacterized protein n=1 Tax=Nepenthes gracilis TaxID=150966 RepID=A0AAD3XEG4_NEPGR|nr:hypothetical protein Nepgr_003864 [Nepenthes gracilis]
MASGSGALAGLSTSLPPSFHALDLAPSTPHLPPLFSAPSLSQTYSLKSLDPVLQPKALFCLHSVEAFPAAIRFRISHPCSVWELGRSSDSQTVKPPNGNLEPVPARVNQSASNKLLATSRQRSSLRAPTQPLEGPDIASMADLKTLDSSRTPYPPVSAPNLPEADSGVNQTMKMASGNDGGQIMNIGC